ncbi:MAG: ribonuclease III domain-containing protein [Clostridia bacterium]|nr:ribonuclease III domain-containing protein [Clostridia bacterium]
MKDLTHFIPELKAPISSAEALALHPMSLAFIGDSVHSLFVRSEVTIGSDKQTGELHKEVTKEVCAIKQAVIADNLLSSLHDVEADIFRRARNARVHTTAKHAALSQYRKASGFEAVIGYLYLTGQTDRIVELLNLATTDEC